MYTLQNFFVFTQRFGNLTQDEFNTLVRPITVERKFDKKELLTKIGEVENYFNFILKGVVRKYYMRGKEEINTQISVENQIIHCQESYHGREPSEYNLEAIEPTVVASIAYDDMEKMLDHSKKMEHMGRMVITHAFVIKDKWQMQMVKMTPRERFINFVTKNPGILQRVPQKYLASYLNIKPETFSRFKHLIKGHKISDSEAV
jgi:CRP-like cAMP-binding protein